MNIIYIPTSKFILRNFANDRKKYSVQITNNYQKFHAKI